MIVGPLWEATPGPDEADNLVPNPRQVIIGKNLRFEPEPEPMVLRPSSITYGEVNLRNGFKIRGMVATGSLVNGTPLPNLNTVIALPVGMVPNGISHCVVVEFSYESNMQRPGYTNYSLTLREKD